MRILVKYPNEYPEIREVRSTLDFSGILGGVPVAFADGPHTVIWDHHHENTAEALNITNYAGGTIFGPLIVCGSDNGKPVELSENSARWWARHLAWAENFTRYLRRRGTLPVRR